MIRQSVGFDLRSIDTFTRPADDAGHQARLPTGLGGREQFLDPIFLEILDAIQFGVLLLQIRRDHECGLPVLAKAVANLDDLTAFQRLHPRALLVGQPYLHRYMGIAAAQALQQRKSCAEYDVRWVSVPLFDDVLGNAVLYLCARPVQITKDDSFFCHRRFHRRRRGGRRRGGRRLDGWHVSHRCLGHRRLDGWFVGHRRLSGRGRDGRRRGGRRCFVIASAATHNRRNRQHGNGENKYCQFSHLIHPPLDCYL